MTFLAIDQLNPRSEEQQTAIRQLLRTFEKDLRNPFSVQNQQINASNVEKKDTGQKSAKKKFHMTLPGFKDNVAIPVDSMAT